MVVPAVDDRDIDRRVAQAKRRVEAAKASAKDHNMRTLAGLPISFPLTTGVPAPQTGGRIARHQDTAQ